jgi:hypothetical protein
MSKQRRPALTHKVIEGLWAVFCSAEPSLESFMSDEVRDREHEKQMERGLTYIRDLSAWYRSKHEGGEGWI